MSADLEKPAWSVAADEVARAFRVSPHRGLTLALAQLWHVFSMRDPDSGWIANEVTRNPWVWSALALCGALLLGAVYMPALAAVLELESPGVSGWTLALTASLVPLGVGQTWLALRR